MFGFFKRKRRLPPVAVEVPVSEGEIAMPHLRNEMQKELIRMVFPSTGFAV